MENKQLPNVTYALINLAPHEEAIIHDELESFNAQANTQYRFARAPGNHARSADIIIASMNSNDLQVTHNLFQRVYSAKCTVFVVRNVSMLNDNEYKYYVASEDLELKFRNMMEDTVREKIDFTKPKTQQTPPRANSNGKDNGNVAGADDTFIGTYVGKSPKGFNGKVLIVDDSPSLRMKLSEFLDRRNFDCHQADSAEAAMKLVEGENAYDIIFMDVVMPGADGYQACKAIKSIDHMKNVPVILLTSMDSPADKIRGVMSGCDRYLTKPVRGSELDVLLQSYFSAYVPPPQKTGAIQPSAN